MIWPARADEEREGPGVAATHLNFTFQQEVHVGWRVRLHGR